jgi:hypothetical protein
MSRATLPVASAAMFSGMAVTSATRLASSPVRRIAKLPSAHSSYNPRPAIANQTPKLATQPVGLFMYGAKNLPIPSIEIQHFRGGDGTA